MIAEKLCIHFGYCGAHIFQEKIRRTKRMNGKKVYWKDWAERFCSGSPEKCIHFEDGPLKAEIFEKFKQYRQLLDQMLDQSRYTMKSREKLIERLGIVKKEIKETLERIGEKEREKKEREKKEREKKEKIGKKG